MITDEQMSSMVQRGVRDMEYTFLVPITALTLRVLRGTQYTI